MKLFKRHDTEVVSEVAAEDVVMQDVTTEEVKEKKTGKISKKVIAAGVAGVGTLVYVAYKIITGKKDSDADTSEVDSGAPVDCAETEDPADVTEDTME